MKFAKVFQQVLKEDHIPAEWVSAAIQYKALKKCINRVVCELEEFGLERDILREFLDNPAAETAADSSSNSGDEGIPLIEYGFEHGLMPKLTVTLDPRSDAYARLERLPQIKSSRLSVTRLQDNKNGNERVRIEINLRSDNEFFNMLLTELDQLDQLRRQQEAQLLGLINELSTVIASVVDPTQHSHHHHFPSSAASAQQADMYVWREIFKEYIEANIFFSTIETDSGAHDAEHARRRLLFFAQKVMGDRHEVATMSFRQFEADLASGLETTSSHDSSSGGDVTELQPHAPPPIEEIDDEDVYRNSQGPYSKALGLLKRVKGASNKNSTENNNNNDNNNNGKSNAVIAASSSSTQTPVGSKIRPSPNSLILRFKHPASRPAFKSFWVLNHALLQALQFQTLNQTAITKILKKFDKQTALNSRHTFFPLISSASATSVGATVHPSSSSSLITTTATTGVAQYHPFVSSSLAKSICYVISERLIPVTPQIDDFLCPICTSITYKPIRLDCNHIFCVRCLVLLQRAGEDRCPICRQNVILDADERNLDLERLKFLKKHFPKETKEKQTETERLIAKEQLDQLKSSGECIVM
jgi:E3 ubiquitin-protein ligase BAH